MMKTCSRCQSEMSEDCFSKDRSKSDGRSIYCKQCRKEKAKNWFDSNPGKKIEYWSRHKRTFLRKIEMIKTERGCYDCGVLGLPPSCYDFDHLPGKEKKFDIAKPKSWKWDQMIDEINKCQVVCSNCHRKRTLARR